MSRSRKRKVGPSTPSDVVRRRVKEVRNERGISAQQLADRLQELDPRTALKRNVLANFESGRRPTVSVDELLLLARALGEPPAAFLVPYVDEPDVRVGSETYDPGTMWRWLVNGDWPEYGGAPDTFGMVFRRIRFGITRPDLDPEDVPAALDDFCQIFTEAAAAMKHFARDVRAHEGTTR